MVLERLITKQRELGLTDTAFAARLGIPRQTWGLTRTGFKPVRRRVALAAMRAFPEMTAECVSFLLSDATVRTRNAPIRNKIESVA